MPRITSLPASLRQSTINDYVPGRNKTKLRTVVTDCIDRMEVDFERRFSPENTTVWSAIDCFVPSDESYFLNSKSLAPLYDWAIKIPVVRNKFLAEDLSAQDLAAECRIFKKILLKERESFNH